ncbi:MAG: Bro-N domain-containing protein [Proteobacteria bacterium]|nr:Bro-N domain-containing protein [Pseudomonadota bacterium]MBU4472092.1 Bro-N domain-containing protein [Pseudomonadota bacterium]MCG2752909.1 Bro-N domain-containing protein [Desulfobacteraceae bacterium]
METKLIVFKNKQIRRVLHNNEWWFVVEDIVLALIESKDPKQYIQRMKQRDPELGKGWVQLVHTLSIDTGGGAQRMLCANTEGIFRIIQSIPSPKAEPFKRWLARVGYERVQEIEDPELANRRTREIYKAKGYSDAWIEKRMRGIAVRAELTEEWKKRDVNDEPEYAILTSEISKAAFGLTPGEYKKLKGLERENLRDHMTDLELIFSMLGEAATTEIARKQEARGFGENKVAARKGGRISGQAREKLEEETGESVVTPENYLLEPESLKRLSSKQGKKDK